jgi:glycerol-3-phosphate acyltransferase PlsY
MWIAPALVLATYLIGSLSGSLLLGRLRGVDIRRAGSGNAGGTNAFRTQGAWFALGTVLFDIGKGALAAWLGLRFAAPAAGVGASAGSGADVWAYACAFAAALGHVWPVFHGFRGGKGAATLVGGLALLWPASLLPTFLVWLLALVLGGYVGLATMLAGLSLVPQAWWSGAERNLFVYAILVAAFLVFTHRANIARLRAGTESRFEGVRLFARLRGRRAQRRTP